MNPDGRSEFMHRSWRHNAIPKTANKDMDGDALVIQFLALLKHT
jgi:hypothetical protein